VFLACCMAVLTFGVLVEGEAVFVPDLSCPRHACVRVDVHVYTQSSLEMENWFLHIGEKQLCKVCHPHPVSELQ